MAPIQRQRRRGLHTVHQVRLQQFRKSVLRQSTVADNIGQTVPDTRCSSSKGTVAEGRVHSDHFQHLTSSTTCPRTTTTSPAAVGDEIFRCTFMTKIDTVTHVGEQQVSTRVTHNRLFQASEVVALAKSVKTLLYMPSRYIHTATTFCMVIRLICRLKHTNLSQFILGKVYNRFAHTCMER